MKSRLLFIGIGLILTSFTLTFFTSYKLGSPGSRTGSPKDIEDCTVCHDGTSEQKTGLITTDIPAEGYKAGETYNITVEGDLSKNMYGFELTAEASDNSKIGVWKAGTGSKLTTTSEAVCHSGPGIPTSGANISWTCTWTAPSAGTGKVTFYASLLGANGDGGSSGDKVYLDNSAHEEKLGTSLASELSILNEFSVFPNPVQNIMNVRLSLENEATVSLFLFDSKGAMVKKLMQPTNKVEGTFDNSFEMSQLQSGNYILELEVGGSRTTKLVVKK